MSVNASKTGEFVGDVEKILLDSIKQNEHNPRGDKDMSVLVPIVVRELPHSRGHIKYELVDGERRKGSTRARGLT